MPTLFDEHEIKAAFKRVSAVKSPDEISVDDARVLRARLDQVIKEDEKRTSADSVRAAKFERAMSGDAAMAPVVRQVLGSLQRLGISVQAASDLHKLNEVLSANRWAPNERLRIKSMLHTIGIL
jgi:hypothetical protein